MAETPENITRPLTPGSTATPGTAPADNAKLAAEREVALEGTAEDTAVGRPFTSEQLAPTCMIWAMFIVMGAFICPIVLWVLGAGLPQMFR